MSNTATETVSEESCLELEQLTQLISDIIKPHQEAFYTGIDMPCILRNALLKHRTGMSNIGNLPVNNRAKFRDKFPETFARFIINTYPDKNNNGRLLAIRDHISFNDPTLAKLMGFAVKVPGNNQQQQMETNDRYVTLNDVQIDAREYGTVSYTRWVRNEGSVQLNRDIVIDYIRDDDIGSLETYIEECIREQCWEFDWLDTLDTEYGADEQVSDTEFDEIHSDVGDIAERLFVEFEEHIGENNEENDY